MPARQKVARCASVFGFIVVHTDALSIPSLGVSLAPQLSIEGNRIVTCSPVDEHTELLRAPISLTLRATSHLELAHELLFHDRDELIEIFDADLPHAWPDDILEYLQWPPLETAIRCRSRSHFLTTDHAVHAHAHLNLNI